MSNFSRALIINWSVWDENPTVSWSYNEKLTSVSMKLPPVAVAHLQISKLVAIVGDFDEFGSGNLFLYSYDGTLQHTITAPDLGENSQFGGIIENSVGVKAVFSFQINGVLKEEAACLSIDAGTLSSRHRSY